MAFVAAQQPCSRPPGWACSNRWPRTSATLLQSRPQQCRRPQPWLAGPKCAPQQPNQRRRQPVARRHQQQRQTGGERKQPAQQQARDSWRSSGLCTAAHSLARGRRAPPPPAARRSRRCRNSVSAMPRPKAIAASSPMLAQPSSSAPPGPASSSARARLAACWSRRRSLQSTITPLTSTNSSQGRRWAEETAGDQQRVASEAGGCLAAPRATSANATHGQRLTARSRSRAAERARQAAWPAQQVVSFRPFPRSRGSARNSVSGAPYACA